MKKILTVLAFVFCLPQLKAQTVLAVNHCGTGCSYDIVVYARDNINTGCQYYSATTTIGTGITNLSGVTWTPTTPGAGAFITGFDVSYNSGSGCTGGPITVGLPGCGFSTTNLLNSCCADVGFNVKATYVTSSPTDFRLIITPR